MNFHLLRSHNQKRPKRQRPTTRHTMGRLERYNTVPGGESRDRWAYGTCTQTRERLIRARACVGLFQQHKHGMHRSRSAFELVARRDPSPEGGRATSAPMQAYGTSLGSTSIAASSHRLVVIEDRRHRQDHPLCTSFWRKVVPEVRVRDKGAELIIIELACHTTCGHP